MVGIERRDRFVDEENRSAYSECASELHARAFAPGEFID
jgi:hypothetical protein